MKQAGLKVFAAGFFAIICLSACSVSLAQDVTPPPNLVGATQPSPAETQVSSTSATPQSAQDVAAAIPQPDLNSNEVTPTVETQKITISGKVTNGSGGNLPAGLVVTLSGYETMNVVFQESSPVAANGTYRFEEVPSNTSRAFMATITYQTWPFNSDILYGKDIANNKPVDLPVTIYETSTDTGSLSVDRLHIFFDYSQSGVVQVVELFIISNPTHFLIAPASPGKAVVEYPLPANASNLQFRDGVLGERYIQTARGFGDTAGIVPGAGQHQVIFTFQIPYSDQLNLALEMPLPVDVALIMAPVNGVAVKSSGLLDGGERAVQGENIHLYTAAGLKKGAILQISLAGRPKTSSQTNETVQNLAIGGGALLLVAAGATAMFLRRRRQAAAVQLNGNAFHEETKTVDEILDEIIALDNLHRAGKIPEQSYQERRAILKEQAAAARQKEKITG
jgi:hypothetical protein